MGDSLDSLYCLRYFEILISSDLIHPKRIHLEGIFMQESDRVSSTSLNSWQLTSTEPQKDPESNYLQDFTFNRNNLTRTDWMTSQGFDGLTMTSQNILKLQPTLLPFNYFSGLVSHARSVPHREQPQQCRQIPQLLCTLYINHRR